MVDYIKCQSELDLTHTFFEKLLLGAIDKRLDHKKMEAHGPAKDGHDTAFALPNRSRTIGKEQERQWPDDETLVGSSNRGNSLHANRSSTMQTLYESQIDDGRAKPTYEGKRSSVTTSRHASPPSAGFGPLPRHITFPHTNQEAEEPEPRTAQRSSTFGSQRSHWWNRHNS